MTKPVWEEEWIWNGEDVYCDDDDRTILSTPPSRFFNNMNIDVDGQLASAAPDMARLLMKLEYMEATVAYCRTCYGHGGSIMPQGGFSSGSGHKPDCEWLRVMKKAGIR